MPWTTLSLFLAQTILKKSTEIAVEKYIKNSTSLTPPGTTKVLNNPSETRIIAAPGAKVGFNMNNSKNSGVFNLTMEGFENPISAENAEGFRAENVVLKRYQR